MHNHSPSLDLLCTYPSQPVNPTFLPTYSSTCHTDTLTPHNQYPVHNQQPFIDLSCTRNII